MENEYYHGANTPIDQFSYTFLGSGKGYDHEGPGFYFTADESDAKTYGQHLFHAKIQLKKPVPIKGKGLIKTTEIALILKNAPNLQDKLMDWDENPKIAFKEALNSIIKYNNSPHEAFQSVWYDFYRGKEQQYLQNMVKLLGYDGVIVPKSGTIHIVVFDPSVIEKIN